ncbi:hypothetical protein PVK06_011864 [Gossypium arboreum]|uniref:Uncharacterized protein n=1 Tax=Gossypium arboreum TaxID=29729 RepID=A0ABR0QA03_GOSAR|nr:hypothetical protein PVK06_011864 [Gossypium arboreum]
MTLQSTIEGDGNEDENGGGGEDEDGGQDEDEYGSRGKDEDDDHDQEEESTPLVVRRNLTRNHQPPPCGTHLAQRCR